MMVMGGMEVLIMCLFIVGFCVNKVFFINSDFVIVFCLFDKDCDGFVMGEGVGVIVFEEFEYVLVCGVCIYVEIVGYGLIGDVYYIIVLVLGGEGGVCVMCYVIEDVGL